MFNPTVTILSPGAAMNWEAIRDEVTRLTQDLIRFNTTNPPGNETPCIEHVAAVLRREGIEPVVLESAPGRGSLVARLHGDGSLPPLLLMAMLMWCPPRWITGTGRRFPAIWWMASSGAAVQPI